MLFGLPIEVVTMLGSSLFSGLMTVWSQRSKDQMDLMKQALTNRDQYYKAQETLVATDKGFSWTRRFIALTVVLGALAMVFAPALFNIPQLIESTSTTSGLFGLFSDRTTELVEVMAFRIPEWWSSAFTAVVGLYFGHSMVKK